MGAKKKKVEIEWSGQVRMLPGKKMVEAEKDVLDAIRTAVVRAGCMCMRNNIGAAKLGGHWVKFGLAKGSGDLICIVPPSGRFLSIEVKRPKKDATTPERVKDQAQWAEMVRMMGGVAGIAKSVADALDLVAEAKGLP